MKNSMKNWVTNCRTKSRRSTGIAWPVSDGGDDDPNKDLKNSEECMNQVLKTGAQKGR